MSAIGYTGWPPRLGVGSASGGRRRMQSRSSNCGVGARRTDITRPCSIAACGMGGPVMLGAAPLPPVVFAVYCADLGFAALEMHATGRNQRVGAIVWHPKARISQEPSALNLVSCDASGTVRCWSTERLVWPQNRRLVAFFGDRDSTLLPSTSFTSRACEARGVS